jgi:hypothetical protein
MKMRKQVFATRMRECELIFMCERSTLQMLIGD